MARDFLRLPRLVRAAFRVLMLAGAVVAAPALAHAQPSAGGGAAGPSPAAKATMAAADKGRTVGNDAAPIWVVVMSDFQCPYCKRWHDDVDATLRRNYVQTGKVKLAFLNFPLSSHRHAAPMAEAAMCASAQGKFWPFHDAVFAGQPTWTGQDDVTATIDAIGRSIGLDESAFRTCRGERQTKLLVEEDARRGSSAGVRGTPAFFIGSQAASGAIPAAEFFKIVDAELAKAKGGARE
jgi:protein-disulfide isomerase